MKRPTRKAAAPPPVTAPRPSEPSAVTQKSAIELKVNLPNGPLVLRGRKFPPGYPPEDPPVIFGHYALSGTPAPLAPNVACVDYGAGKGGVLTAYRWDGERVLDAAKFVRACDVSEPLPRPPVPEPSDVPVRCDPHRHGGWPWIDYLPCPRCNASCISVMQELLGSPIDIPQPLT